jgi:hypothetical protein
MSAKDLAVISFLALPQGKAEGGKLETEQLKHYCLSIISKIDEMQEFHDYICRRPSMVHGDQP